MESTAPPTLNTGGVEAEVTHGDAAEARPNIAGRGAPSEVGDQAVWSLSTAKPGNGVDQLRDASTETYWQSDGPQPHLVNIQFHKKTRVQEIAIYTDYKLDESYTPSKISIRAGTNFHDLQQIKVEELLEPSGWTTISLMQPPSHDDGLSEGERALEPLRTYFIQLAVLANHQNGRDTHIRQIRVYSPRSRTSNDMALPDMNTLEFQMYACVR
ncbi:anaphase-promoting complex, subunit 10/DOC domain-containing protein [Pavlovales sp. CCMP2436]|nr:anaphase-promoting complex, subunit 10/DOC domain-containing protein [Pavlovales sp. CCMP2436]